jgi:hypothetical protein
MENLMAINFSELGGAGSSTVKTYLGGAGVFTVSLPSAAYNVTPHTALTLDGTELAAGTDVKVFGSITTLQSTFGLTDFASDTEISSPSGTIFDVAYNGSRLVVVTSNGSNPIYYSDNNGASWTAATGTQSVGYSNFWTVVWEKVSGRFLATGKTSNNEFAWLQSSDGITWTELSRSGTTTSSNINEKLYAFPNGTTIGISSSHMDVLKAGETTVNRYQNSYFLPDGSSPDYSTNKIYFKKSGQTEYYYALSVNSISNSPTGQVRVSDSATSIDSLAANGDTIVAFYGSTFRTSTDGGATWTSNLSLPSIGGSTGSNSVYINGQFLVYGYDGNSSTYSFAMSADGLTWSNTSEIEYASVRQYRYYDGKLFFVFSSRSNYYVLSSPVNNLQATIETLGQLVAPDA